MTDIPKICFIYTQANGLHDTNDDVSKKNLYCFERLVTINYDIGYKKNNEYLSSIKVNNIIKPRTMHISENATKIHGITMTQANNEGVEIELVLDTFIKNLSNVAIIVTFDAQFTLRTIMAELVRYNKPFSFTKYIIIDIIDFYHNLKPLNLDSLYLNLINNNENITKLEKIKLCFLKLYDDYEKSII